MHPVLAEILKMLAAAVLGGLVTTALAYFKLGGSIRALGVVVDSVVANFNQCHAEHVECPDNIKAECEDTIQHVKADSDEKIRSLADVVKDLSSTTSTLSADLHAHLKISQQLDQATEARFSRIEVQLTRIEFKLDQLKGWHMVPDPG